jgi:hypothetical protein
MEEWHLRSEPWLLVVDGQGITRATFEGLTTARAIAAALQQTLDPRETSHFAIDP